MRGGVVGGEAQDDVGRPERAGRDGEPHAVTLAVLSYSTSEVFTPT